MAKDIEDEDNNPSQNEPLDDDGLIDITTGPSSQRVCNTCCLSYPTTLETLYYYIVYFALPVLPLNPYYIPLLYSGCYCT